MRVEEESYKSGEKRDRLSHASQEKLLMRTGHVYILEAESAPSNSLTWHSSSSIIRIM